MPTLVSRGLKGSRYSQIGCWTLTKLLRMYVDILFLVQQKCVRSHQLRRRYLKFNLGSYIARTSTMLTSCQNLVHYTALGSTTLTESVGESHDFPQRRSCQAER